MNDLNVIVFLWEMDKIQQPKMTRIMALLVCRVMPVDIQTQERNKNYSENKVLMLWEEI